MFKLPKSTFLLLIFSILSFTKNSHAETCPDVFNHSMRQLHSENIIDLCELTKNKPTLVINTASHCGFTKQFESLEAVHKKYSSKGLVVIGFASNDFNQENKDEAKAAEICYANYGVTFTMLAPSHVKGEKPNPVFNEIIKQSKAPKWNFNKYLIDEKGIVSDHFGSFTKPSSKKFQNAIEKIL